jgi:hypothetical protein
MVQQLELLTRHKINMYNINMHVFVYSLCVSRDSIRPATQGKVHRFFIMSEICFQSKKKGVDLSLWLLYYFEKTPKV